MGKIQLFVELQPFRVPNYVIQKVPPSPKEQGFKEAPKYHLSQLDSTTLNKLCDQFRDDIFSKAQKSTN